MKEKKISLYSLTTTYANFSSANRPSFVHVLNKELVRIGIKIKTLTPHSKGEKSKELVDGVKIIRFRYLPEDYEINSSAISDEVSKSRIGLFKVFLMSLSFFIFTYFECLKERPDVLHGHWAFPGGFIAYIISKIFGKKFIVTIHGGEIPLLKKFNQLRKIVVHGLNNSSVVIANSNYTKNELVGIGVKEKKIIVHKVPPNFVNHSADKEFLMKFRKKFTEPDNQIILFVGRLVERKGTEFLINALSKMETNNVHLIIVGGGELLEKLKKITQQQNLGKKVTFFGRASSQELGWLHDISDVFVCPSIVDSRGITEYLGLVIPEAMESGLAVIATSVGGIVDTVKNEVNGLIIEQKNPEAVANAIERIFSDEELKNKMIENSKKTVKEFSPETIAQEYFKIFDKIVK